MPNIDPQIIDDVANTAIKNSHDITTLAYPIKNDDEVSDPNIVKIAIAFKKSQEEGRALYFSRSPIPCSKNIIPITITLEFIPIKQNPWKNLLN